MNLDNIFQLVMILLLVLIVICIVIRIKKIENIENIDEHYSNIIENFTAEIIPTTESNSDSLKKALNSSGNNSNVGLSNRIDILSNKVSSLDNKITNIKQNQMTENSKLQKEVDANTKYIKYIQEEEKALKKNLKD